MRVHLARATPNRILESPLWMGKGRNLLGHGKGHVLVREQRVWLTLGSIGGGA